MHQKIQPLADLTKINGIGVSVQKGLRDLFQVRSYADLAALSVDDIEKQFKAEKSIPAPLKTREKIGLWITEAKELAESSETQRSGTDDIWEPIDSFVLEFQSKRMSRGDIALRVAVQHVEHDANSHWDFRNQKERERLFQWMEDEANLATVLEQAVLKHELASELAETNASDLPDFSWEADLKPLQVSLIQGEVVKTTSTIDMAKRPFLAHISHEQPLDLEVTFVLPCTPTTGDSSLRYSAQCQMHNLSQRMEPTYMQMGTTENLDDEPTISAKLSKISLEPGIYKLGVLLRGERPLGANYYEFPKLNVL